MIVKGEVRVQTVSGEIKFAGDVGPQGKTGPEGKTGPANNLLIGTVEKGEEAKVWITGEPPNQTLHFIIPKGDTGERGEKGEAGNDGKNGTEIELQATDTYIQWRYVGTSIWNNLIALSLLKGDSGKNGIDGQNGADGTNGIDGRGIVSFIRTSGTGSPGTTDTYTITYTDNTTTILTIYNGKDGETDLSNVYNKTEIENLLANKVGFTDYATGTEVGVVKANGSGGITVSSVGNIYTVKATNTDIDNKTNNNKVIVPSNLDYAVHSVMDSVISAILEEAKQYTDTEIATFDFIKIVDVLPETGLPNRFYFVPKTDPETQDLFDEYIWVNNGWEYLGVKQIEIDLTDCAKKEHTHTTSDITDLKDSNFIVSNDVDNIWTGSKEEYETLESYNTNTLYCVKEEG